MATGKSVQIVSTTGSNSVITASTTWFESPIMTRVAFDAALETQRQTSIGKAATASRLGASVTSNSRSTSTVIRFRKNGANGNQVITVLGSATGYLEDASNSDSLAVSDLFCFSVTTGTGSGGFGLTYMLCALTATSGNAHVYFGMRNPSVGSSTSTIFCPPYGIVSSTLDSTVSTRFAIPTAGTVSNLQFSVSASTKSGIVTTRFRKNAANGNGVITSTATATGIFEDTLHTDSVAVGDLCGFSITAAGTGAVTVDKVSALFTGTADETFIGGSGSSTFNAGTDYTMVGDSHSSTIESLADVQWPMDASISNLFARADNWGTGTSSVTARVNGVSSTLTASNTGAGGAQISDTTHAVSISDRDHLAVQWQASALLSTTFTAMRVTNRTPAGRARRVFCVMG